jgi:hypothetical protein
MARRMTMPSTATRLVMALLLLGAVFAMHGLSCTDTADRGAGHSAPAVTIAGPSGHAMTAAAVASNVLAGPAAADHAGPSSAIPGAGGAAVVPPTGHGSAPHSSAAHLWAACLAVLAAGLAAMLALLAPHVVRLVAPALSRALTGARGSLPPPRPPDLHAPCLLRT